MKNIEIDKKIYNIPDTFFDITLGQYEDFIEVVNEDEKKDIKLVSILLNMPEKVINNIPIHIYNDIVEELAKIIKDVDFNKIEPKNECIIENKKYIINYFNELTVGEYIDCESGKLSDILAVLLRPATEKYNPDNFDKRKLLFRQTKLEILLPVLSFFLLRKNNLQKTSHFTSITKAVFQNSVELIKIFKKHFGKWQFWTNWQMVKLYFLTKLLKWDCMQHLIYLLTKKRGQKLKQNKENMKTD